ncbi:hypothetical protein AAHE18_03G235100 [Arachis hypogaea]|nr:uncharacterized protein DS421_3g90490 [Arachis hypogaea]
MDSSTAFGGSSSSATLAHAVFDGGLCRELTSFNILLLPTELILKIFLLSDGKTIRRGRCMSRDWFNRLSRLDRMVTHLTTNGGEGVVLHLDNPLKDVDCGCLSFYIFDTWVEVPVTAPFDWKWFSLVGSAMGKVCARFSIDGRSSSLVIWNPFSSWRSLITDPGLIATTLTTTMTGLRMPLWVYMVAMTIGL